MRRVFLVYGQYIRIAFSTSAAYRLDFFFTQIITLVSSLLIPLLTVLIYANGAKIPGWSFQEALLLQSVFMLCTGVCAPFFNNMVWTTMEHVREGTYDLLMLKPGSTVFITMAGSFGFDYIGTLAGGIGMFAYSLANLPPVNAVGMLQFLFLFAMGICMDLGCILLMSATCFRWVGNSRIFEIYNAVTLFSRYPTTVFGGMLQAVITYAIPVAMLGFFPASAILGRATPGMLLSAVPCAAYPVLGWLIFRRMLRRYQSAGG
jgi:ABC-2 type transport system permease protein